MLLFTSNKKIKYLVTLLSVILIMLACVDCAKKESQPETKNAQSETKSPQVENRSNATAQNTLQGNIAKLQGKWKSNDDSAFTIEIIDNKFISMYNNKISETEIIKFVNNAEERLEDPDGEYFILKSELDELCFYLINVNQKQLEYSYVSRGNTLSFTKIE
ncbi:MAG: hypothetical protein KKH32_06465 [Bacteroidetes bacterium]|nr:hypothetical protein [Bacteroidota bacterium]